MSSGRGRHNFQASNAKAWGLKSGDRIRRRGVELSLVRSISSPVKLVTRRRVEAQSHIGWEIAAPNQNQAKGPFSSLGLAELGPS